MRSLALPAAARTRIKAALLLGLLTPLGFGLGFGLHGPREETKREIIRLEQQWRTAQLAGDLAALDRLLAEDYVGVNLTGQVHTKIQLLNRFRTGDLRLSRIDMRNMRVKLLGDVAVVRVYADVQGVSQGAPIRGTFLYTRVYHRLRSGQWQITNFEATRVDPVEAGLQKSGARVRGT